MQLVASAQVMSLSHGAKKAKESPRNCGEYDRSRCASVFHRIEIEGGPRRSLPEAAIFANLLLKCQESSLLGAGRKQS